jgi:hypothetical protein
VTPRKYGMKNAGARPPRGSSCRHRRPSGSD